MKTLSEALNVLSPLAEIARVIDSNAEYQMLLAQELKRSSKDVRDMTVDEVLSAADIAIEQFDRARRTAGADSAIAAAERYRKREQLNGGYVILNGGVPTGWMDRLGDPRNWMPGVIAVSPNGIQWIAQGGDEIDGAKCWARIN